jgi:hypothetical protein
MAREKCKAAAQRVAALLIERGRGSDVVQYRERICMLLR